MDDVRVGLCSERRRQNVGLDRTMKVEDYRKRRQRHDDIDAEKETLVCREIVVDGETRLTYERLGHSRLAFHKQTK